MSGSRTEPVLGIDGALGSFSVALVGIPGEPDRCREIPATSALEGGLGLVAAVLDGMPLRSLGTLAVGTGPGRFTGMRIAVAYAKSLVQASGVPLAAVSSYDALEPADAPPVVLAVVEGRPGLVCGRLRIGASLAGPWYGAEAEVAQHAAEALRRAGAGEREVGVTGAAGGVAAFLAESGITVRAYPPAAPAALAIAARATRPDRLTSPHALVPDYGAEPTYVMRPA